MYSASSAYLLANGGYFFWGMKMNALGYHDRGSTTVNEAVRCFAILFLSLNFFVACPFRARRKSEAARAVWISCVSEARPWGRPSLRQASHFIRSELALPLRSGF